MDARKLKRLTESLDAIFDVLDGDPGGIDDFIDVLWTLRDNAGDATLWQNVDRWLGVHR